MEIAILGVLATVFGLAALSQALWSVSWHVCPVEGQWFMFEHELKSHAVTAHLGELVDFLWDGAEFAAPPVFVTGSSHTVTVAVGGAPGSSVAGLYIEPEFIERGARTRDITTDFAEGQAAFNAALPTVPGTYLVWLEIYNTGSMIRRLFYRYRIAVVISP